MLKYFKVFTVTIFFLSALTFHSLTLEDLRENDESGVPIYNGQSVTNIEGIVNVNKGVFQPAKCSVSIQHNGFGVTLFSHTIGTITLNEGDLIKVSGTVGHFNGLTQIQFSNPDTAITKEGTADIIPYEVRINDADWEEVESTLVKVRGVITYLRIYNYPNNGFFYLVDYEGFPGKEIQVYCTGSDSTDIDLSRVKLNDIVDITGVVGQYDNTSPYFDRYQIKPRSDSDIVLLDSLKYDEEGPSKAIFDPRNEDDIEIVFNADPGSYITIRVYDLKGRIKRTLVDFISGSNIIPFDGKNDNGEYLTLGAYVININILKNLDKKVINFPIVIASPLK